MGDPHTANCSSGFVIGSIFMTLISDTTPKNNLTYLTKSLMLSYTTVLLNIDFLPHASCIIQIHLWKRIYWIKHIPQLAWCLSNNWGDRNYSDMWFTGRHNISTKTGGFSCTKAKCMKLALNSLSSMLYCWWSTKVSV